MDILKKVFPFSFSVKPKDVNSLVVSLVIYVVAAVAMGLIMFFLGLLPIPFLGIFMSLIGWLVELYVFVGVGLTLLNFFNVLK